MIFLISPISVLGQQFIIKTTSIEDYSITRNINIMQSIGRLAIIPLAIIAEIKGWILGQIISIMMILFREDFRSFCKNNLRNAIPFNWRLIIDNLPEAIHLGLITTLWMQLLSSGRVFATFKYPDIVVAQYGLAGAAYQVFASLIIAAFIPQTIKTYKLLDRDPSFAVIYVLKVIMYVTIPNILLIYLVNIISPEIFKIMFSEFKIDTNLFTPLIYSLVGYPVIVTLGALLIGTKRNNTYLIAIIVWCFIDWYLASKGQSYFGYNSAAVAQLISISLFAITLLCTIAYIFHEFIKNKWLYIVPIITIFTSLIACLYSIR
jgi:hypothetical protein